MTPIAFMVDDGCPLVHVYRVHWVEVHHRAPVTESGAPLLETVPNSFLADFCDLCEHYGVRGKFSIVPAPGGRDDVVRGIEGYPPEETVWWLDTVKARLLKGFDISPEGLTHNLAIDLATGSTLPVGENEWSQTQTRETLRPYLIRGLQLLKEVGIDATGFTSPWAFGIEVEDEYTAAMMDAQREVWGREDSWYFLHSISDKPSQRPWVARREGTGRLVSIPATVPDLWWRTINEPEADLTAIAHQAYEHAVRNAEAGGIPVVLTHWQSQFSNGSAAGLRALEQFFELVHRDGRFTWTRCSDLAAATPDNATR
jgi:hypothetical protein